MRGARGMLLDTWDVNFIGSEEQECLKLFRFKQKVRLTKQSLIALWYDSTMSRKVRGNVTSL